MQHIDETSPSWRAKLFSVQVNMVGVVQLAEHRIVVPGVVGSSPITHPIKNEDTIWYPRFLYGYSGVMGLERPTPVRTLVGNVSGGHFLGRGRAPRANGAPDKRRCVAEMAHCQGQCAIFR